MKRVKTKQLHLIRWAIIIFAILFAVGYLYAAFYRQWGQLAGVRAGALLGVAALIIAAGSYVVRKKLYRTSTIPELANLGGKGGMFRGHEQQSDILLRAVADGVIVTDTAGIINLINPAGAELISWPADEAVGLDVNTVIKLALEDGKPLPEGGNPFQEVMSAKQAVKTTLQLSSRDGRKKTVSLVVSPVVLPPDYELVGAVAVMRDISRQHQEEMQRAEFISTASHEMRTPVAAIEGYLALAMNERVSSVDSRARDYLQKAHTSTQHLGKLFQDLLTSARAEDGRLSNHPVVVELGAFLELVAQDLRFAAEKKGLKVEFIVGSGESIDASHDANSKVLHPLYYTNADPDRLREVITNLFDNAIKYTDAGKISLGLTGNNELVQFFIRDTGAGIPADDIPHLFQKFYRVNSTLTRTQGGTGLGLFISRKIIELYGGRIWVESEAGRGSTFYINLPRLTSQKAAELQAAEHRQTSSGLPDSTKVQ